MPLARSLGLRDLVLFNVTAIIGLRWVSLAAAGGSTSITLWLAAMALFFLPQAFAVVELTRRMPEQGGVYLWTKNSFGEFHGFMAGWCYWTNNLVYFPNLLVYVAGVSVFVAGSGHQALGESKPYVLVFSLLALALVTLANVLGLSSGKWIQNVGGVGTWASGAALVAFGAIALAWHGVANPMPLESFFTGLASLDKLSFWAGICFAFAGLELGPVLAGEVRDPRSTIPRAVLISGIAIVAIYVLGTLALLVALPAAEINIISGFLQAIAAVADKLGLGWATNALALLVTLGGLGGLMAWFTGSARMAFVAGVDRFLPDWFGRVHPRYGSPYMAVIVQAGVAVVFVLMSFVGATVEEAYLVLLDTTLLVYFVPYLYLFAAYLVQRRREPSKVSIPASGTMGTAIGAAGLTTTLLAMAMALIPPDEAGSASLFFAKVLGGFSLFVVSGALIYWLEARRRAPATA